jgi:hypothetical protein
VSDRARVIASLKRHTAEQVVALAINVQAELIEATPVDTGFAASNWPITTGAPASGTVGIGGAGAPPAGYKLDDGSVYVTNNAQYIQVLNGGSSTQAPAGFVEQAIARGVK